MITKAPQSYNVWSKIKILIKLCCSIYILIIFMTITPIKPEVGSCTGSFNYYYYVLFIHSFWMH